MSEIAKKKKSPIFGKFLTWAPESSGKWSGFQNPKF